VGAAAALAQGSRSVWDGFYTEAQAKRGEQCFYENCVTCHGPALEGDGKAPPLSGGEPCWAWDRKPVGIESDPIRAEEAGTKK
jgi:mono/diheme cytochrome c family protein